MKLIDKSALVAEIEKWLGETDKGFPNDHNLGRYDMCKQMLSFIDTLKAKEVDLENEIDEYISNNFFGSQTLGFFANRTEEEPNYVDIALCARHFFKLGLKAKKGE